MTPSFGYQIYQAERNMSRNEIVTADTSRGRQAAAVSRGIRRAAARSRVLAPAVSAGGPRRRA